MNADIKSELTQILKELVTKWNNRFYEGISVKFQEQLNVLEHIRNNFQEFEVRLKANSGKKDLEDDSTKLFSDFHASNFNLLEKFYDKLKTKNEIRDFTENLKTDLINEIQFLQLEVIDEYDTNADYAITGIGSNRFLRKTGNFFYNLRSLPLKTRNWVARILKKPLKYYKVRYHTIHFQLIVKGFFLYEYINRMQSCTSEIQKKLVSFALSHFEYESRLIHSGLNSDYSLKSLEVLPDINEQLKKIEYFYDEYEERLLILLEKSGTWEFPLFYIRNRSNRNLSQIYKVIDTAYRLWDSTFYAFYEDWRFREQLFSFINNLKLIASQTVKIYSAKLDKTFTPVLVKKREYLESLVARIPDPHESDPGTLKHFFSSELYKLNKEVVNQSIEEDFNKTRTEVEKVLKRIEIELTDALEKLPDKSGVVRAPNYEKGIRRSEIYFFSSEEFIRFECIPPFLNRINSISRDFSSNFDEIVHELSDFDQITDFTLDTAISLANEQNDQEKTILMFREGLTRSLNILEQISGLSDETVNTKEQELTSAFTDFIGAVEKLDDNDSILSIYSRLLKSKALKESKEKRKKIFSLMLSIFSFSTSYFKKLTEKIAGLHKEIRRRLKLDKAPVFVSSEISNYLADINRRIYQIPVVYRYLFENTPVREANLFLARQYEVEKINDALKDWKAGNFAATLVIGEKGSGKSSLLQNYLKTIKGSFKVNYHSVSRFYHTESDFYELMQDIFENRELDNDQKILEQISAGSGQQIIVLDGLERAFVRKPGGFDCLQKLLSLIVSTNEKIYWLCAASLNACDYLDKTISLKENFDYLIELDHLSPDQIKGIVLKRHRLSGYIVNYEDEQKVPTDKKKLKARQIQLENEFFNELNKFASSNISLSLSYWLESVSRFTENELYIKQFHAPDFSFLETLSAEKIYTLLLIALHGRITVDLHAMVSNQSIEKSRRILTILKEDSIVLLKDDHYILNSILYRHVIQLMKNKNLIH